MDFLLLILLLGVFLLPTFFLSRQQKKRQRQVVEMQSALQPGDRVVTAGGMHGEIVSLGESTVEMEIAPGVVGTFERSVIVRHQTPAQTQGFDPTLGVPGTAGTSAQEDAPTSWEQSENDDPRENGGFEHPENRR